MAREFFPLAQQEDVMRDSKTIGNGNGGLGVAAGAAAVGLALCDTLLLVVAR